MFSLDPLPPRLSSDVNQRTSGPYIPRQQAAAPPIAVRERSARERVEEDEIVSAGPEEVEVVESVAGDQEEAIGHQSEHDDQHSEHSEHEPENQAPEHEDGKIFNGHRNDAHILSVMYLKYRFTNWYITGKTATQCMKEWT